MGSNLFIILFTIVLIYIILRRGSLSPNINWKGAVDYSFGLEVAQEIKTHLENNDFQSLEALVLELSSDDLTQVLDYIGLSHLEENLLNWLEETENTDIPNLFLGVFYNHEAWIIRSHNEGAILSKNEKNGFRKFQEISLEYYLAVDKTSPLIAETYCRLIRVFMGMGLQEEMKIHFYKAIEKEPNRIWSYIRFSEAAQPKWGGSLALIQELKKQLPPVPLIRQIVKMKLLFDSLMMKKSLFGGTINALRTKAKAAIIQIDEELSDNPPTSIHRYIAYNYLHILAETLGNKKLKWKYAGMYKYYTLYPHGILRDIIS